MKTRNIITLTFLVFLCLQTLGTAVVPLITNDGQVQTTTPDQLAVNAENDITFTLASLTDWVSVIDIYFDGEIVHYSTTFIDTGTGYTLDGGDFVPITFGFTYPGNDYSGKVYLFGLEPGEHSITVTVTVKYKNDPFNEWTVTAEETTTFTVVDDDTTEPIVEVSGNLTVVEGTTETYHWTFFDESGFGGGTYRLFKGTTLVATDILDPINPYSQYVEGYLTFDFDETGDYLLIVTAYDADLDRGGDNLWGSAQMTIEVVPNTKFLIDYIGEWIAGTGGGNTEDAYNKVLHDIKPKLTGEKTNGDTFSNTWITPVIAKDLYVILIDEILVELAEGTCPLVSLENLRETVITSDDADWVKNPANRKNAMVNKIDAVIELCESAVTEPELVMLEDFGFDNVPNYYTVWQDPDLFPVPPLHVPIEIAGTTDPITGINDGYLYGVGTVGIITTLDLPDLVPNPNYFGVGRIYEARARVIAGAQTPTFSLVNPTGVSSFGFFWLEVPEGVPLPFPVPENAVLGAIFIAGEGVRFFITDTNYHTYSFEIVSDTVINFYLDGSAFTCYDTELNEYTSTLTSNTPITGSFALAFQATQGGISL